MQLESVQTLATTLQMVAMVRMVFAGVFKKYPDLKVMIHHHGATGMEAAAAGRVNGAGYVAL